MKHQFQFPEKDAYRAMEATKPDFDITKIPDWEDTLHISLAEARGNATFEEIAAELGYFGDQFDKPSTYSKILFSGHKGSGKTTELLQFADNIESKGDYIVVRILLERLRDLSQLQPEDVYMLYILRLLVTLQSLKEEWIEEFPQDLLQVFESIAEEFNTITVSSTETTQNTKAGIESSVGVKASLWTFLKLESKVSGGYMYDEKVTQAVRKRVKDNLTDIITKINQALGQLTHYLAQRGLPSEILFLIDGFEKTLPELYEHIFKSDPRFISQLEAHTLCCIPIKTYYDVSNVPTLAEFSHAYLPMLRQNPTTTRLLLDLVHCRVSPELFENGVLEYIAEYSGGSPRQMLKLVSTAILKANRRVVTQKDAEKAVTAYGLDLYRTLTRIHQDVIESGKYMNAEPEILNLMYAGVLLEYNGDTLERHLNPVLRKHFPNLSA